MSIFGCLVAYFFVVGHLPPLIQGQVVSSSAGTPSCNPPLSMPRPMTDVVLEQPYYLQFLPWTELFIPFDNECYTVFPLEGQNDSYQLSVSRVYYNGSNEIFTYLLHSNQSGVFKLSSPDCKMLDTVFKRTSDNTMIIYRCYLEGGCHGYHTDPSKSAVFGVSSTFGALPPGQMSHIEDLIRSSGLPPQRRFVLPMRRPARCVTRRICQLPRQLEGGRRCGP